MTSIERKLVQFQELLGRGIMARNSLTLALAGGTLAATERHRLGHCLTDWRTDSGHPGTLMWDIQQIINTSATSSTPPRALQLLNFYLKTALCSISLMRSLMTFAVVVVVGNDR